MNDNIQIERSSAKLHSETQVITIFLQTFGQNAEYQCKDRFLNDYTLETLKEHLISLAYSNCELISERSKSIPKFVLSTIGTLISGGYMDGSRPSEIIKKIDFRRPLESTQRDYISKGWKDVRIIHDFLLDITD